MKNITAIILFFLSITMYSQDTTSINLEKAFDFWIGHWDLEWTGENNEIIKGHNHIVKILDGTVIQENFEDFKTGFKGTSISVYNSKKKEWHQAWADNKGGYYNFIGEIKGDKRIFKTIPKRMKHKVLVQRMVFYDITPTGFVWDWQSSTDNGRHWKLLWRIRYKKSME